jgi:hypothetical protein
MLELALPGCGFAEQVLVAELARGEHCTIAAMLILEISKMRRAATALIFAVVQRVYETARELIEAHLRPE